MEYIILPILVFIVYINLYRGRGSITASGELSALHTMYSPQSNRAITCSYICTVMSVANEHQTNALFTILGMSLGVLKPGNEASLVPRIPSHGRNLGINIYCGCK